MTTNMKIAVIGAGLIGSAAARHLALMGVDVTLIGPLEPETRANHSGVFASHYDEGRITRGLDPHPFWSRVSRASIARYAQIEAQSGIRFYTQAGSLMAGPKGSGPITSLLDVRDRDAITCDELTGQALRDRFPYFHFADDTLALFEPKDAGHISPRKLVAAQIAAGRRNGVLYRPTIVTGIDETGGQARLQTPSGALTFDRALVATGGFSDMLLGDQITIRVYARTAALMRLPEDEAQRLTHMPTLIYLKPNGEDPYMLPPIRYPDGHTYLKMGGDPQDVELSTAQDIQTWFRSDGSTEVGEMLVQMTRQRIPDLAIHSHHTIPCVTTYTDQNLPLIRPLSDHIYTAIGGNGRGAKNSDELGRLAALRIFDRDLPDDVAEYLD